MQIDDLNTGHHAQYLCRAIRIGTGFFSIGRRSSKRVFRNNMNGVISNGRDPLTFSIVGIVVSVNCTWQLAHHEMTPVFPSASLSSELVATRPDVSVAGTQLNDATTMGRAAHDTIRHAQRVPSCRARSAPCAGVLSTFQPVSSRSGRSQAWQVEPFLQRFVDLLAGRRPSSYSCMRGRPLTPSGSARKKISMPCLRGSRSSVVAWPELAGRRREPR